MSRQTNCPTDKRGRLEGGIEGGKGAESQNSAPHPKAVWEGDGGQGPTDIPIHWRGRGRKGGAPGRKPTTGWGGWCSWGRKGANRWGIAERRLQVSRGPEAIRPAPSSSVCPLPPIPPPVPARPYVPDDKEDEGGAQHQGEHVAERGEGERHGPRAGRRPGGRQRGARAQGDAPGPAFRAGRAWPPGLGGRGRRSRDRGRGAAGRGPVGSEGESAAGCPGPDRSSCDPSPAAPSLSSPRSRRGGAGGGAAVRAPSGGAGSPRAPPPTRLGPGAFSQHSPPTSGVRRISRTPPTPCVAQHIHQSCTPSHRTGAHTLTLTHGASTTGQEARLRS